MNIFVQVLIVVLLVVLVTISILDAAGVFTQTIEQTTNNNTTNNTTTRELPLDPISGHVSVIETDHTQLHGGRAFHFSDTIESITDGSSQDYLYTATSGVHLRFWMISANAGPVTIGLYENPTVSSNGTEQTVYNMNRFSSKPTTLTLYAGPTVSSVGTLLEQDTLFNSKKDGAGATTDNPLEWILSSQNTYLVRVTNSSSATIDIAFKTQWYHVA